MKAFKLLFQSKDLVCIGDAYATDVVKQPNSPKAEFFCINPLDGSTDYQKQPDGAINAIPGKGRRADLNVTAFRNFLFEMDNTPLDEQQQLLNKVKVPWATITYSGGKSYHAIVSLAEPLAVEPHTTAGVEAYKKAWKALAYVIAKQMGCPVTVFDSACQNPSRLSRMPDAERAVETPEGVVTYRRQELIYTGRMMKPDELAAVMAEAPQELPKASQATRIHNAKDDEDMRLMVPVELHNRLRYPASWGADKAGNYPTLLKLVLWLIDSTGANKEMIVAYLEKNCFPALRRIGYPEEKLMKPVDHAFAMKGLE